MKPKRQAPLATGLILPLAMLTAWEIASRTQVLPAYLMPSPEQAARALLSYFIGSGPDPFAGRFAADAAASVTRILMGFSLAVLLGLPLGLASGRSPGLSALLAPAVSALRAVPGICWLPLSLVWLGIGLKTTVFLIALAAFFPIYINAAAGAASVEPLLPRAGAMLGLGRAGRFFRIILPAAMPQVRAGLRLGLGLSFAYLVLGELTGVAEGLGAMIMDARLAGRVDMIVTGIAVMAVLGFAADAALTGVLRLAFKSARRL